MTQTKEISISHDEINIFTLRNIWENLGISEDAQNLVKHSD